MPLEVDFPSYLIVMNVIFAPLFPPLLSLEGHWERTRHLDGVAHWQIRTCFVVQEPNDLVVQVHSRASELLPVLLVEISHCDLFELFIVVFGEDFLQALLGDFADGLSFHQPCR